MAEGTKTYMGLAVPIYGESEIQQQVAATDILSITGATSQSGDFIVCQDGSGNEKFVVSSSGLITSAVGITASGIITASALSSTTVSAGVVVSVTSTGAIAAGATLANGVLVQPSSKAKMNAAFAFKDNTASGDYVGVTNYLLACHGSKAPTYFLGVGGTAVGVGAATDNGFVDAGLYLTSALATTVPMVGLKVQFGDSVFYVMCVAATAMAAS